MANVELNKISKSFGALKVLDDVSLSVGHGEFLTLVGPSGCGKSTLIRIIAGLENQTSGSIAIDGAPVDQLRPHERRVAMVFQSYALYPHMSVFSNIALPLTMTKLKLYERLPIVRYLSQRRPNVMRTIREEVRNIADQLQIGSLLDRRPSQLSGGQRQRVALARAMVRQPAAFLMDEPLSNLDAKLRVHMRSELTELHQKLGATFIYVTHDQVEAMTMSTRVAMMEGGRILQLGTPDELYRYPTSLQVAQFIGSPVINLLPGRIGTRGRVEFLGRPLTIFTKLSEGSNVTLGIRPEALRFSFGNGPAQGEGNFPVVFRRSENLGSERILHYTVPTLSGIGVAARTISTGIDAPAAEVSELIFSTAACHVFDDSGRRVDTEIDGPQEVPKAERLKLARGMFKS